MTGNILFDSRRMFRHACAFADCAMFCEREPNSIVVRTQWHTVPDIVNSAFACEVFIKSLLVFNGFPLKEIRGHELAGLLKQLETKDLETVIKVKDSFDSNEDEFNDMINNISNAFEQWRYVYEKHSSEIHLNFLRLLRSVLREVCCEKLYNMTWSEYLNKGE